VISPETRMMGLPYGEEIMIVGRTMWTQSTSVTDRRRDRQTDGRTDRITITKTVLRLASHGKNKRNYTIIPSFISKSIVLKCKLEHLLHACCLLRVHCVINAFKKLLFCE